MRVVSLVPSLTEAVCVLGRAGALVGVTDYCLHPAQVVANVARVGGTKNPDLAEIATLQPDLVLANRDEQRADTLDELARERYDVLVTDTDSLADVAETWTQLGLVLDAETAATRERRRLEAAVAEARESSVARPRLSTLVPIWKKPWMAAGGGTYLGDLLDACGFDNVLAALPQKWVRFEPYLNGDPAMPRRVEGGPRRNETVHSVPRRPDTILLPTEPYVFGEPERDEFATLGVTRDAVRVVDGELLTWWLSRTVAALEYFTGLHRHLVAELPQAKKADNASAGSSTRTGRKSSGNARA